MNDLKTFNAAALKSVFPTEADNARNAQASLADGEQTHRRKVDRRRFIELEKAGTAADTIGTLPTPGEIIHGVMTGSFHGFSFVRAVLKLAAPATITRLHIATLGFNAQNTRELFELIDAGKIGHVEFIASTYFKSLDPDIFENLHAGLASRGSRCVICRSHAKLLLFEMTDARAFVWESSANLRSCRNVETFTLTDCHELLAFHRAWMQELADKTISEARK